MRILGLDHGTKRIGVALSDELQMFASPLEFIPAEPFDEVIARLNELIREKEVELILIGMPRNMDGTYGPATEKVKEFIAAMQQTYRYAGKNMGRTINFRAGKPGNDPGNVRRDKRKENVDKMAAALLLQSFSTAGLKARVKRKRSASATLARGVQTDRTQLAPATTPSHGALAALNDQHGNPRRCEGSKHTDNGKDRHVIGTSERSRQLRGDVGWQNGRGAPRPLRPARQSRPSHRAAWQTYLS